MAAFLAGASQSVATQATQSGSQDPRNRVLAETAGEGGQVALGDSTAILRGQAVSETLVPIHTAEADMGLSYGVWAAGNDYKVSFHDGATFVPFLGKDYPHNQPLKWRTTSVQLGGLELATHAPRLSYQGMRAEYDLGSVIEAYDVRSAGVEQTFVLQQRRADGDLVIRGAVQSQLHANNVGAAHQPLHFLDAQGLHLATYGAATAIDANGRMAPMTTSIENGEVTLRLEAAWLATASFPVTVDPLLGPGSQISGNTRDEVDVVRDSESVLEAVWMGYVVWASASDRDVYLRRFTDSGQLGSSAYTDVTSTWSTQGARCAYDAASNRIALVFDRYFPLTANRLLRFHSHLRSDLTSNTTFSTIATSNNAWRADVGGTVYGSSSPSTFVVWQQEPNAGTWQNTTSSDIYGCYLDLSAGTATTPFVIANNTLQDQERPSVNQTSVGIGTASWMVAYQTISTSVLGGDDWDIAVRQVRGSGNVSAAMLIDNASSDHKMAPMIEGRSIRYLVAFTSSTQAQQPGAPTGSTGHEVRVVRVDWGQGSSTGSEPYGTKVAASYLSARADIAGLGHDRGSLSHWAVMHHSDVSERLYFTNHGYQGDVVQSEIVINPPGTDESVPGGISFNEFTDEYVIAYAVNAATNYVTMDRFAYPAATPASMSGIGCSPAALSWVGSQSIGNGHGYIRVVGAASDSLHVMVLATQPAAQILTGISIIQSGCWLLVPNTGPDFVGLFGLKIGANPVYSLPLPEFLSSDTFYFQDFHTIGNGNLTLISTPRLELQIVK